MRLLAIFAASLAAAQSWTPQSSGTTASLRGIAAVNDRVAWASGAQGTYLRTTDGGATWRAAQVPGAEALDFRDVHAVDERTAWLLASGPGDKSRIYRTTDGGEHWTLQFTNPDPAGFLDAIAFWDAKRGLALGDPVGGRLVILATIDGEHWTRREGPPALAGEGAFAASGTCLTVRGERDAWFGTGGARAFHSSDGGATWTAAQLPMRHDGPGAGIFSIAFRDADHGMAVGGDYTKPNDPAGNFAVQGEGGRKPWWGAPPDAPADRRPHGYRSAVAYSPALRAWIAAGPTGSDLSTDDGRTWRAFDKTPLNALDLPFAVGPKGAIARLTAK